MCVLMFSVIYLHHAYVSLAIAAGAILFNEHIKRPDGDFVIDYSDPEKDIYRLEIGIPFGDIEKRKELIFKVKRAR